MLEQYFTFWVDGLFQGQERLAAAIGFTIVALIIIAPLWFFARNSERARHRDMQGALYAEIAAKAPAGATDAQIRLLMEQEVARRRAEVLDVPEVTIRMAPRPADGTYYRALRRFAEDKRAQFVPLHEYEALVLGPFAVAEDLLGDAGLAHLDSFEGEMPVKGWELRKAMEAIGLLPIGEILERAVAVHLHRYQLITDMLGTGMPQEQALAHPDLPSYADLTDQLQKHGGIPALVAAADSYFEKVYPWADEA